MQFFSTAHTGLIFFTGLQKPKIMNNLIKRNSDLPYYDPWDNMENFFPSTFMRQSNLFPSVNISEDDKNYCVDVVAPGFNKEDFKVNVEDDMLTISAEAKSEYSENNGFENSNKPGKNQDDKKKQEKTGSGNNNKNRQYSRREYSYSSFTRSFRLPENAKDGSITANYKDGVLQLNIPKTRQQEKATKQIPVS